MADNEGGGGASRAAPPPRPTIALPPRTAYASLFRGSGVSPGPMTLVSSFFSEDPDAERRSFSQLLAGAMASPVAAVEGRTLAAAPSAAEAREERSSSGGGVKSHRPLGVMVAPSSFFTVPPGLSPANLLESPSLFSPSPGPFGISHQQALAHVTAQAMQAAQANAHMHVQVDCQSDVSSVTLPASSALSSVHLEQTQTLTSDTNFIETTDDAHCKQRSQPAPLIVDKPADDGYNWRKYGQKQVKGSESSRSYYKCTHSNCPVKKKVQRSLNGQVTEIIYKGQHNHTQPPPNKRAKESSFPGGSTEVIDVPDSYETGSQVQVGNMNRPDEPMAVTQASRRDQESGLATAEQLSGSSDGEEVGDTELRLEEGNDIEHDPKRSKMETRVIESNSSHRTLTEPRIIVQTRSKVDLLDDGYRWRKYGQKVVKGNPNPRSYYKCTNSGCNVRKHIERASTDPAAVITTYEGKHNHDVPAARDNSHVAANAGSATNVIQPRVLNLATNPALLKRIDFRSNVQQHVAVLQLKEEQEIT